MTMNSSATEEQKTQPWLSVVASQVESLRFGIIQIVVHDSRVVQIDRTEKLRFDKAESLPAAIAAEGKASQELRGGAVHSILDIRHSAST
jgi:hypothetical protein